MELVPALLLLVAFLAREWVHYRQDQEVASERAALLQRIQAPLVAVQHHATENLPVDREPIGPPLEGDAEYWALVDHNAGNAS